MNRTAIKKQELPPMSDLRKFYAMLKSRPKWQCISHTKIPTWEEHLRYWRDTMGKWSYGVVRIDKVGTIGYVYLTDRLEVGIQLDNKHYTARLLVSILSGWIGECQHMGYGNTYYFNVAPRNHYLASIVNQIGGSAIQTTYKLTLPVQESSTCAR